MMFDLIWNIIFTRLENIFEVEENAPYHVPTDKEAHKNPQLVGQSTASHEDIT
jgi:hypothetical protein